jgi:hypothetical protein
MSDVRATLIEAWFAEHDSDGEFAFGVGTTPCGLLRPGGSAAPVIYTTKPTVVSTGIDRWAALQTFGVVGKYGLPDRTELNSLCAMTRDRNIVFLGDMDPVDLMIFVWLRMMLQSASIAHYGINDRFLGTLAPASGASQSIPLSLSEQEACVLLEKVFPDMDDLLGPQCRRLLAQRRKLELEAILSGPMH